MLNTKEFAAHWGVAPKTVRRWIDDNLVDAEQAYLGGPYYIPEVELHRFRPGDSRRNRSEEAWRRKPYSSVESRVAHRGPKVSPLIRERRLRVAEVRRGGKQTLPTSCPGSWGNKQTWRLDLGGIKA